MAEDPSNEFLYSGDPPLKRGLADSLRHVIECGLDSPLTDDQCALFESQLIDEWQRGAESRAGIENSVKEFKAIVSQINSLPPAKRTFAWREVGRQLYMYAEQQGKDDPVGKLILELYQNKNSLLVPGSPPLSRQAAENYAEMSAFFHGLVARTQISLTAEQKAEVVAELGMHFPNLPLEEREQISQADILWGLVRYSWRNASRDEREQFRQDLIKVARAQKKPSDSAPADSVAPADSKFEASSSEAAPETASVEAAKPEALAEEAIAETDSKPKVDMKELAKNSKFIEAIQRLRMKAAKSSPFQFRKR